MSELIEIPPDPEGQNEHYAELAAQALDAYVSCQIAGVDAAWLLADALRDLRHWADYHGKVWDRELFAAMEHYRAETNYSLDRYRENPHADAMIGAPPADPEDINKERATYANAAVELCKGRTKDVEEKDLAFSDLLNNLRHWADRNDFDWEKELARAMASYGIQTKLDSKVEDVELYLRARGFGVIETGGGCTAWSRIVIEDCGAWEILVTERGEASADLNADTGATLGVYELKNFGTDDEERDEDSGLSDIERLDELPAAITDCIAEIQKASTIVVRPRM